MAIDIFKPLEIIEVIENFISKKTRKYFGEEQKINIIAFLDE